MKIQCYYSVDTINKVIIIVSISYKVCENMTENYKKLNNIPDNIIARGLSTTDIQTTWNQLKKEHKC